MMTRYIVVSSNEIVKAEMERPEDPFGYYSLRSDDGQDHNKLWVDFETHCLSLPRIPIEGEHKWEVWQSVEEGKDFIFIERCCVEFHVLGVSECESSDDDDNPCKCSVAIPIQPTPEGENDAKKTVSQMAEIIQKECHSLVSAVMKESKKRITVQDATNAYMFHKLAELQLRINQLEESQHSPTHQR